MKKEKVRVNSISLFLDNTTEEERNEIAEKVASKRIIFDSEMPLSWAKIRQQLDLKNDDFHKVIRVSESYRQCVEELLQKQLDKGWWCKGDLDILAGFRC